MTTSDATLTSDALTVLRQAHDIGLGKLQLLSDTVSAPGWETLPESFEKLAEVSRFFEGELRLHFRHEEEALFPALEKVFGRQGMVMAMLEEHQSLWRAVDAIYEKVDELKAEPEQGREKTARTVGLIASHIVGLLRSHIDKENTMLLPLAAETLSAQTLRAVSQQVASIH